MAHLKVWVDFLVLLEWEDIPSFHLHLLFVYIIFTMLQYKWILVPRVNHEGQQKLSDLVLEHSLLSFREYGPLEESGGQTEAELFVIVQLLMIAEPSQQ